MLWSHWCTMDPEEVELQNDYRYRNYAAVIEKALRNFESSSEWADLISSLGKLIKVCNDAICGPNGINAQTSAFAIWCLYSKRLADFACCQTWGRFFVPSRPSRVTSATPFCPRGWLLGSVLPSACTQRCPAECTSRLSRPTRSFLK